MVYIHFLSCITFEYCFKWLLFSCIRFSIRSKVLFLLFVHKHIHVWNDNLFIHTTLYLFIFSLYNQPLLSEKKAQSEEEVIKNRKINIKATVLPESLHRARAPKGRYLNGNDGAVTVFLHMYLSLFGPDSFGANPIRFPQDTELLHLEGYRTKV